MQQMSSHALERNSGISMWRQIADQLRHQIAIGEFASQKRLPSEMSLARQFNVNRHTVRAAINALAKEGIVESRQGQGTFVRRKKRMSYPIGKRTRFSDGFSQQAQATSGVLLAYRTEQANMDIAKALSIELGEEVICLETLSEADGVPLSRATSWFHAARYKKIAEFYKETRSITRSLALCGVDDYVRSITDVEAHHASMNIAADLKLSPGAIVLITLAINNDLNGNPIQYSRTSFAADRVSLSIKSD